MAIGCFKSSKYTSWHFGACQMCKYFVSLFVCDFGSPDEAFVNSKCVFLCIFSTSIKVGPLLAPRGGKGTARHATHCVPRGVRGSLQGSREKVPSFGCALDHTFWNAHHANTCFCMSSTEDLGLPLLGPFPHVQRCISAIRPSSTTVASSAVRHGQGDEVDELSWEGQGREIS